jgi:lysozyme
MTPRHHVSRAAIELIKRFEGYRRRAARLPDGRWTIGYGHTLTAREGSEVSESDAEALLLYDLIGVAHTVSDLTYADLTQNQFDALCAFAVAIGLDAFRGSDVLKRVNEGAFTQAAFAMELWRKAEFEGERIVIDAMVRRRAAEKLLFLTPANGAWRAVPSAVLRPLRDDDALDTAPRETPAQVIVSLEGDGVALSREDHPPARLDPDPESPVRAAAEAVTARLQALFAEPVEPADREHAELALPEPEPEAAEPEIPEAEAVEAEALETQAAETEPPEASTEESATEPPQNAPEPEAEPEPDAEPAVPTPPANDVTPAEPPAPARVIIDDTAPFEFVPPPVQPIDGRSGDSVLAIVSLTILGLAFFAGGMFWAFNAPAPAQGELFTPLLVGWLAGVAGVGFAAAAVFMLLQRVTRAAERR